MARNIEIKARIESVEALLPKVKALADRGPEEKDQDDTFFLCPNGRLKLRTLSSQEGQLVFYKRPDQKGPKECFYLVSETREPDLLREILLQAYGACGRVRKHRTSFMAGRTRVYLDRVEGLGDFLELEVMLREAEAAEDGVAEAYNLLARLGVDSARLIDVAYVDLLKKSA